MRATSEVEYRILCSTGLDTEQERTYMYTDRRYCNIYAVYIFFIMHRASYSAQGIYMYIKEMVTL